ncbi:MAG: hypothetical protein ACQESN_11085, partial [Thermotogota bacterium]
MPKYIIENGVAKEVNKFKKSDPKPDENARDNQEEANKQDENIAKELEEKTVPELREVAKELEIELKT